MISPRFKPYQNLETPSRKTVFFSPQQFKVPHIYTTYF